jgi:hypothetical protein
MGNMFKNLLLSNQKANLKRNIILKVDHLRTIHAMFALNWLTGYREEDF